MEQTNEVRKVEFSRPEISIARAKIRVLVVAPSEPMVGGHAVQAKRLIDQLGAEETLSVRLQPINPQLPEILHWLQEVKYVRTVVTSGLFISALLFEIPTSDIVHVFSAGDSSFLLNTLPTVLISKLFGKKAILNYRHGGADAHFRLWRRSAVSIARLFDKIIVPSNFLVDVFSKFDLKAEAISNFVNSENYRFRVRENLQPVFLSNRSLESGYNIQCILRAFGRVQSEFGNARLIIAGDGRERAALEKLSAKLGLMNVEFLGNVSQFAMPGLYDRCDIYLNSPDVDNMPTSIIEAFSSGTPVVSTSVGGIPIIVQNEVNGLLVPKNDDKAMAKAALRLLHEREFAHKITSNAFDECAKYSWENVRGNWLRAYGELVGQ